MDTLIFIYVPKVQQWCRKKGGGARWPAPGVTILGWHHIMKWNHISTDLWRRFFYPSSFELKTNQFNGKDFFWFWNSQISGLKKPITLTAMTFFLSSLVFGPKRGDTTKFRPGATIPSNASVVEYLYTYRWYSVYMRSSGTVSISKSGCCNSLCPLVVSCL